MSKTDGSESSLFESKFYFDLGDASQDVTLSYGAKEKAQSTAKLAGKTLFNTGLFAGKAGFALLKKSPEILKRMTEEVEKKKSR